MKIIVQNVKTASVEINSKIYSSINKGYCILVSFTDGDNETICNKIADKLLKMRVFQDNEGKTNLNIDQVAGQILSISQFTLYASLKEGNRPSFTECLYFKEASRLYDYFNEYLKTKGMDVKTGIFGEDMLLNIQNDGPFTTILDSEELIK